MNTLCWALIATWGAVSFGPDAGETDSQVGDVVRRTRDVAVDLTLSVYSFVERGKKAEDEAQVKVTFNHSNHVSVEYLITREKKENTHTASSGATYK